MAIRLVAALLAGAAFFPDAACLPAQVGRYLGATAGSLRQPSVHTEQKPQWGTLGHLAQARAFDHDRWVYWWEHHRDLLSPPVRPRGVADATVGTLTEARISEEIVPALLQVIDASRDPRIVSATLVALAKIGFTRPEDRHLAVMRSQLGARHELIRDAAALSLGIAGSLDSLELLRSLALDQASGREATACRLGVPLRTRIFALCGLGLLVEPPGNSQAKAVALQTCRLLLADTQAANPELATVAVLVLGMLNPDASESEGRQLQAAALNVLADHFRKSLPQELVASQAQCATAIARLLGRHHPYAPSHCQWFADELLGKGPMARGHVALERACVLALGQLAAPSAQPKKAAEPDASLSQLLLKTSRSHNDPQTRGFALLALGQIGGPANRQALLAELDQSDHKAWCAMALGVLSHQANEAQLRITGQCEPDREIGEKLLALLQHSTKPDVLQAAAIALGLNQRPEAAESLRSTMQRNVALEELSGYCAEGLGLLRDQGAVPALLELLPRANRRPELALHVATALGQIGDQAVASKLVELLANGGKASPTGLMARLAQSIGMLGDARTVAPLLRMLQDPECDVLVRAFAAGALGCLGDAAPRSWQARLGGFMEYRGLGPVLVEEGAGVLCWL